MVRIGDTSLQVELFGEVRAWRGAYVVELGPAQQRAVFALLVLSGGRPVSRDTLVSALWRDDPPRQAANAIQTHVMRLRRTLDPGRAARAPSEVLARSGDGYLLRLAVDQVDVLRFRRLVSVAREAHRSGDHGACFTAAEEALRLWQAAPVADLPLLVGHPLVTVLADERWAVVAWFADAALRRGTPGEALAVVGEAVLTRPLDEPLHGWLIRLYAALGRRVDALGCYDQLRRRLVDELGVDPTPQLRDLHQTVLRGEDPRPSLHRDERRADTLDLRAQARRPRVERLGVEPGTGLHAVHREILADPPRGDAGTGTGTGNDQAGGGDPSRLAPATGPPAVADPSLVAPRQLPPAVRHFVGRTAELDALSALVPEATTSRTVVISTIGGTGGIGKTTLAVHWAHRIADQFPDGQLYLNLRGFDPGGSVMEPAEAVRRILDALQVPPQRIPTDLDAQAALYRSQLAGRRMLIILDNARDSTQVRPLLPGEAGCLVLVTSRNQLTSLIAADGAHSQALDLLTDEEARQLLARRIGVERVAAQPRAVAEIVARCARLPLALAVVAARAALRPQIALDILAGELRDTQQRWEALAGDDPTMDVRAVFSWSYQTLTPAAARLFRLLGLHAGPDLSTPVAASLAGAATSAVRPLLAELIQASLLVEHTAGRYTLHDLLRAYATQLTNTTDTAEQRHEAISRMLDHYLHTAYAADRLLYPSRDPITLAPLRPGVSPEHLTDHQHALDWFTAEHPALLAAVQLAVATGFNTHTWQLARTLTTFLDRRGRWQDWAAAGRAAVTAAARLADPPTQVRTQGLLAYANAKLGAFDDAGTQLTDALELATRTGDQAGQAHTRHNLAFLRGKQGRYAEALEHAQHTLDLHQITGRRVGQAEILNNIAWYQVQLGDFEEAVASATRSLGLSRELGHRACEAQTSDTLGYAHHHLGQYTQAISAYQHSLDLQRDLGDRFEEAEILVHLGDTHRAAGHPRATHDAWKLALAILDELDHPDAENIRTRLHDLTDPDGPEPAIG